MEFLLFLIFLAITFKDIPSTKDIERELNIYHSNISSCCKHKKHYNTAGGYKWEYLIIDKEN